MIDLRRRCIASIKSDKTIRCDHGGGDNLGMYDIDDGLILKTYIKSSEGYREYKNMHSLHSDGFSVPKPGDLVPLYLSKKPHLGLTMERIDGVLLNYYAGNRRPYIEGSIRELERAMDHGWTFLDLGSGNIMVTENGIVLIDFISWRHQDSLFGEEKDDAIDRSYMRIDNIRECLEKHS